MNMNENYFSDDKQISLKKGMIVAPVRGRPNIGLAKEK